MNLLLLSRRFWPLFFAQSLGAFADNTLRYATISAITIASAAAFGSADFTMPNELGRYAGTIVSVAFTLPVLIFSVISGQLADKVDRHKLVRILKVTEVMLMAFSGICLALGNAFLLIFSLILMGTQSAFFSPVRNALMPQYYQHTELPRANGYFNAALFAATISGLIVGAYFIAQDGGRVIVAAILIAASGLGAGMAYFTPKAPAPGLKKIDYNVPKMAINLYKETSKTPGLIYPMIGIGWFWMIGAANLAMLPNFVSETLQGSNGILVATLTLSAIGAGVGSIASGLISSRVDDALKIAGVGVIGTIIGLILCYVSTLNYQLSDAEFWTLKNIWLLAGLTLSAAANGMFAVPIMSALHSRTPESQRAQIMGTSNMTNGGMATLGAVAVLPPLAMGWTPPTIFLLIAFMQVGLIGFMWRRRVVIRRHANIGNRKAAKRSLDDEQRTD